MEFFKKNYTGKSVIALKIEKEWEFHPPVQETGHSRLEEAGTSEEGTIFSSSSVLFTIFISCSAFLCLLLLCFTALNHPEDSTERGVCMCE